jgi:Rho GTPase-activating protein 12/27
VAHRETLKTLFKHLLKVISLSSSNRMHLQNIALVFGPTICRLNPLEVSHTQISNNIMVQNELVEYVLFNFNELFDEYHKSNSNSSKKNSEMKA